MLENVQRGSPERNDVGDACEEDGQADQKGHAYFIERGRLEIPGFPKKDQHEKGNGKKDPAGKTFFRVALFDLMEPLRVECPRAFDEGVQEKSANAKKDQQITDPDDGPRPSPLGEDHIPEICHFFHTG